MANIPNSGKGELRVGDYSFFCDLCGGMDWASKATKLSNDTGHGNAIVCPRCVDTTDWSLVPYKIPAERPVPWSRSQTGYTLPAAQVYTPYPPFNYRTMPGELTPNQYAASQCTWDKQNYLTWDQWFGVYWQNLRNS